MKISMNTGGTTKWFAVTVASSDKGIGRGSKFDQLISDPDWNPDCIDFKIVLNGIEFDNLENIFIRLDEHITKEAQEIAGHDSLVLAKVHAIQDIINAQSLEEVTGEWK